MISALNSTVSALQAYIRNLGVTANNISNVNTDGYKKYKAVMQEGPTGNVQAKVSRVDTPGYHYRAVENSQRIEKETSNVELVDEIPDLMITRRAFEANIKSIQTQDKILGSLLDIIT